MLFFIGLGTHLTAKEIWLQVIGWSLIVAIPILAVYADGWERSWTLKRQQQRQLKQEQERASRSA